MRHSTITVRASLGRWVTAPPPRWRIAVTLTVLALTIAACGGQAGTPDTGLADEAQASPWASSEMRGKAFGRLWLQETRDQRDLQRPIDAYRWAIRTCQSLQEGQTPSEVMARVARDGFTEQGATVIVRAAKAALCPDHWTV